jgi:hypothetical protein
MATLTIPNTFNNGATIVAAEHNANFTAVKSFAEALSAGTNIDAGAITTSALANSSVTTDRIATYAVTGVKIEPNVALTGTTTAAAISVTGNVVYHTATNAQSASAYTIVLADDGKIIECSASSAITLTVPTNTTAAFPIGTQIMLIATGTGQVTVAAAGGVTVNATPGLKLRTQWSTALLIKRATNTWLLSGDLQA